MSPSGHHQPDFSDTPPHPPIDAEIAEALRLNQPEYGRIGSDNLAQIRQQNATDWTVSDLRSAGWDVHERGATATDGSTIPLVVIRPAGPAAKPLPVIYYIHGGGMISGSAADLSYVLDSVRSGHAIVVSIDYRLAPEHPDPTPREDCYTGLQWAAEHADEFGGDPHRILLAGVSAGGGLAAGVALMARDRGGPALTHQFLVYPMLDDRFGTVSSRMLDGQGVWDRNENLFGWTALLGERRGTDAVEPYTAPARATDLTGLPPTFMDVGSVDSFRDEVLNYAGRLSEAGICVELHMWAGGVHAFEKLAPQARISRACEAVRADFLNHALLPSRP